MAGIIPAPTSVDGTSLQQSAVGVLSLKDPGAVLITRTPAHGTAIGQALVSGNVYFFGVSGGSHTAVAAAAENTGQTRLGKTGTIRSLKVHLSANAATGGQIVLRKSGADTLATLNPSGAGTGLIDLPGAVGLAVAPTDVWALKCAPTGGGITIDGIYLEVAP